MEQETKHDGQEPQVLRVAEAGIDTSDRQPVLPLGGIKNLPRAVKQDETGCYEHVAQQVQGIQMGSHCHPMRSCQRWPELWVRRFRFGNWLPSQPERK